MKPWEAGAQDAPGLARLLLAVLLDARLRARLGAAARETALRFSPDIIADRRALRRARAARPFCALHTLGAVAVSARACLARLAQPWLTCLWPVTQRAHGRTTQKEVYELSVASAQDCEGG